MYVSHMAMLAAAARLSFWSTITREERSKRLAGGASPSADFIRCFRTSMSVPSLSAQMFFYCVSTLFAWGVKGAERKPLPASYGTCTKRTGSNSSLPHGKHRVPDMQFFQSSYTTRTGQKHCLCAFFYLLYTKPFKRRSM